jgi:hypothetical protein
MLNSRGERRHQMPCLVRSPPRTTPDTSSTSRSVQPTSMRIPSLLVTVVTIRLTGSR